MTQNSELYLQLPADVTLGISSTGDIPIGAKEELLLGAYLPGVKITDKKPLDITFQLDHKESSKPSLGGNSTEAILHAEWSDQFSSDLPHLLYSIARQLWLERGLYTAHAACVGGSSGFTLLPGYSGTGKSTTTLTLATQFEQQIFSGNTTLLQFDEDGRGISAVAGTKTMTLRTEDFEQYEAPIKRMCHYGSRTAFEMEDTFTPSESEVAVKGICLVKLDRSGAQETARLSPASAVHTLYSHFLDTEYADCVVAGGAAIFTGETPLPMRTNLAPKLMRALGSILTHTIMGDREYIASTIHQL